MGIIFKLDEFKHVKFMARFYKLFIISLLSAGFIIAEVSGMRKDNKEVTAKNLRVLPRNISHVELIDIMKGISKALGVKCDYCHVAKPGVVNAEGRPELDFASDDKPTKRIARKMMRMTKDINEKLNDIGDHQFEKVGCVTCHRGWTQPSHTVDSLQRQAR
jgi:hypothetical protein